MADSRTTKSIRNTAFSLVYQLTEVILNFILKTIFIYSLGKSYLGISGLFSNILTVLSMMDLGIGGAIVFCLYKPLAEHDYGKVHSLMVLYRKVYSIIGILVCVIGFSITPLLHYIINLPEEVNHIYLIYWFSIANTAVSYFMAYRRSLLIADQRTDINVKNLLCFKIIRFILLSSSLILTRNYLLYIALDVLNTFISNVQITFLVKKRYLNVESANCVPISQEEKQKITKYVSSGIFFKFGQTVVNCTDSIIISAFVNTIMVGLYSNYSMITSSLEVAVYLVFSGVTASIGNFAVEKDGEQSEILFRKITFVNFILSMYLSVCVFALINPFISIWVGRDYLLSEGTLLIIVINFYIATLQKSIECFMGANGAMYYHNRFRSLIEGIVNLVSSIVLVKYTNLGIAGVFLGTTICFMIGRMWMDAFVLYKYWFNKAFLNYIFRYFFQVVLTAIVALVGRMITTFIFSYFGISILTWIFSGVILSCVIVVVVILFFRKKDEFKYFLSLFYGLKSKFRIRK